MRQFISSINHYLHRPIIENFPFFVICSLLLLPHTATGFFNDVQNHFGENSFLDSLSILIFNSSEVFAFIYLCCLVICLTKCKFIKVLLYFFFLSVFGINLYLRICFGTLFSSNTMMLIAETNRSEALEFFETFAFRPNSIVLIAVITFFILLLIVIEKWYHEKAFIPKSKALCKGIALSVLLILCLASIETWNYAYSFKNQTFSSYEKLLSDTPKFTRMDYCRRMINSIFFLYLSGNDNKEAVEITEKEVSGSMHKVKNDSLTIIVVIGESFIKSHASVYGYPLNTMPNMREQERKGNLITYNHAITSANHTSISLRNFFSCNSIGDGERWCEAPFFPAFFKASGYNVFFWDNQYNKYTSSDFDFALNAYIHNLSISKLSYDKVNETNFNYDGELVEHFIDSCMNVINKQDNNTLVLFHLMGQHFNTEKRYPNTQVFCHFNADSIRKDAAYITEYKKSEIANYDNAVLYNDFVLDRIIATFKDRNAIMLFFSDHGELVYDVSDVVGRTLTIDKMSSAEMAHYYEIPLLFWYSDQYRIRHPEMINCIKNSKDKPLMSDNMCQLLFHIANIKTKWYFPRRDVLSPNYQCPPRIIENTINYDNIKNRNI